MTPNNDPIEHLSDRNSAALNDRQRMTDAISTRAYFLWESAGRPDGRDDDFWCQAESDLNGQQGA